MARNTRKADPTQVALSAIEEALQIGGEPAAAPAVNEQRREAPEQHYPPPPPPAPEPRYTPPPAANAEEDRPVPMRRRPMPTPRRLDRQPRSAANDDRQSVGQILAALQGKPSRAPFYIAAAAAVWWIVMAIFIGYTRAREDIAGTSGLLEVIDLPYFWSFFATLVLPPIAFLMFASLIRRSEEMRFVSRAMTMVTMRLAEPEGVSTDAIVSVGQAIRREVAALGDGIERAIARATELESMVRSEVSGLERAYDDNEVRVRGLIDELRSERDAVIAHGTRLREAFANTHESFTVDVESLSERLTATIDNATHRVTESISTQVGSINDATNRVTDVIASQAEQARTQISSAGDAVIEAFGGRSIEATDRLTQVGFEIAKALGERTVKVTDVLNEQAAQLTAALSEQATQVTQQLDAQTTQVTQSLADQTAQVTGTLNESVERVSIAITERGETVRDMLTSRLQAAEETITLRGTEIADRVSNDSSNLARRIADSMEGFDATLKVYGTGLVDQATHTVNSLHEHTRTALSAFDERVKQRMTETEETIDSRIARVEQTLDARTQSLNEALANRTLEIARSIADGARQATQAVDQTVAGMGEYFAGKAQEIAVTITERTEAVDQVLGRRALEVTENLDSRIQRFEDQVANRLEGVSESIESKGLAVADALGTKVDEVTTNLRSEAEKVEHTLSQLSDQVSNQLGDRMNDAAKLFVEQTSEVAQSNEILRDNVMSVLERLREANNLLQQVMDGVVGNLRPMESNLAGRLGDFQDSLEATVNATRSSVDWVEGQMRELKNISSGVLRDLSVLTQRFEGQGRLMAGVVESLSETHGRIDQTLADRRVAMDQLVHMLSDRTAEIETKFGSRSTEIGERLAGFTELLTQTLENTETRAQEIAKYISETATQTSQTINRQHELIRSAYSEERGRTSVALKATYDEAMDEIRTVFRDLQERFAESAREVRDVSHEIQSSLDQTRDELKRGVMELPQETRESAEAMRRVVADQIKALAELNSIVSKHDRALQVTEAASRNTVVYDERMTIAGGGRSAALSVPAESPTARPAATPRTGEHGDALPRREGRSDAEPRRSQPPADPRRTPRDESNEHRSGFQISEILGRNAQGDDDEEDEAPPQRPDRSARKDDKNETAMDSLDSLSVDISRVIDHDAAVELWDRHRRGERNVLTRRLYTRQGQKTFEDIRRKYRKSADFRDTVDRYIDEFERLLDQVSRDDRGQVLSKTYLTSDTGKVYTLLAHAAGKLS